MQKQHNKSSDYSLAESLVKLKDLGSVHTHSSIPTTHTHAPHLTLHMQHKMNHYICTVTQYESQIRSITDRGGLAISL
jgi:hypothetical protein